MCVCGGGGGVFKNVLYGEAPLRGPTPYPFMNHFWQIDKKIPLLYTFYHSQFRTLHPFQLL